MDRDFKGVWIPKKIWLSDDLTILEKAIFAEIDSLDGENHCYASNEYLSEFCQVSVPTISRAISKLISYGYIELVEFDGRQRVLKVSNEFNSGDSSNLSDSNINLIRETYQIDKTDLSKSEFLLLKEKNKENNREGSEPEARRSISKNHSKIYKETESLEDRLSSGEEIDKQKREKKKSPAEKEREKCLDMIEKSEYSDETKSLLVNYYEWASSGTDKRRIKDSKLWAKKLDALSQFVAKGADVNETIKNSIEHKYYMFVIPEKDTRSNKGVPDDGVIGQTLHGKEVEEELARRKELYGVF